MILVFDTSKDPDPDGHFYRYGTETPGPVPQK